MDANLNFIVCVFYSVDIRRKLCCCSISCPGGVPFPNAVYLAKFHCDARNDGNHHQKALHSKGRTAYVQVGQQTLGIEEEVTTKTLFKY